MNGNQISRAVAFRVCRGQGGTTFPSERERLLGGSLRGFRRGFCEGAAAGGGGKEEIEKEDGEDNEGAIADDAKKGRRTTKLAE